ncbi:MAG: GNAT family N-acetyltransferase [Clostridia bacterium]
MIDIKKIDGTDRELVYKTLMQGFADYTIEFKMHYDNFYRHFFVLEGNDPAFSYIAFYDGSPAGVLFSGMREYEGMLTMRLGALSVIPEMRRKGIATAMMERHFFDAERTFSNQLFLEITEGDDIAADFYKSLNYFPAGRINYFTLNDLSQLFLRESKLINIEPISLSKVREFRRQHIDAHIIWQNDVDFIDDQDGVTAYNAIIDGESIGMMANTGVNINYLFIIPEWRNLSIASTILAFAARDKNLKSFYMAFPATVALTSFALTLGFKDMGFSQIEMVKPIAFSK